MTEDTFWRTTVRPNLAPFGSVHRIENYAEVGTPDTLCCLRRSPAGPGVTSMIELKHAYKWPVRQSTPLRFNYLELEQVLWHEGWHEAGGRSCLLCQVALDYLLIPPESVRAVYEGLPRGALLDAAAVQSRGKFPTGAVVQWLTR